MQLLRSIFCFQGVDTRQRFLAINIACYIIMLSSYTAFINHLLFNIFILAFLFVVIALTSLRRLNDAQLKKAWCSGPSVSFLIVYLIIIITNYNSAHWLLLFPIMLSSLLMTYPSKAKTSYILGYSGPVDLSDFDHASLNQQRRSQRIEPTINTDLNKPIFRNTENQLPTNQINTATIKKDGNKEDIGVLIRLKLLNNKIIKLTLIGITILIILAITIPSVIANFNNNEKTPESIPTKTVIRTAKISFPDNFSLLLSQHHGLIINWQADSSNNKKIWDLLTAQGDKNCKAIVFNNGTTIRTTNVVIENSEQYFANFSPLDTQSLLQEIAFRGNFTLCDYKFSLKGSQAILGKHTKYAKMVAY